MRAPLPIRAVRATFAFSQTYAQTRREARRVPRVQHAVARHVTSTYPRAPTMLADLFAGFITGVLTIVLLAFFGSGDREFAYHA